VLGTEQIPPIADGIAAVPKSSGLCQQLTEMMHRREPAVRARRHRRDSTHPEVASPTFFGLKEFAVEISVQIEARL